MNNGNTEAVKKQITFIKSLLNVKLWPMPFTGLSFNLYEVWRPYIPPSYTVKWDRRQAGSRLYIQPAHQFKNLSSPNIS